MSTDVSIELHDNVDHDEDGFFGGYYLDIRYKGDEYHVKVRLDAPELDLTDLPLEIQADVYAYWVKRFNSLQECAWEEVE